MKRYASTSFLFAMGMLVIGCGGGGSTMVTPPPPAAPTISSLALTCAATSVPTSQTTQCAATVTGTGAFSETVAWSVDGAAGGDSTHGTVSASGLYTAPAKVPAPFTVTVTATSTEDSSKSANFAIVVAGTIASVQQPVSAAAGGTITLPGGGSAVFPPNALAADETFSFSENSTVATPLPGTAVVGVGPVLDLQGASPGSAATVQSGAPRRAASSPNQVQFQWQLGQNSRPAADGATPLLAGRLASGKWSYEFVPGGYDSATDSATASVDPDDISGLSDIQLTLANFGSTAATAPLPSSYYWWNGSSFQPVSASPVAACPLSPQQLPANGKLLVLVHGMLSSVQGAFTSVSKIEGSYYGSAVGFNYDWTQRIAKSGSGLANFLDSLAACSEVKEIGIEAHSEGVPVMMSAGGQVNSKAAALIRNVVAVAGPITGTPLADSSLDYMSMLYNGGPGLDAVGAVSESLADVVHDLPPLQDLTSTGDPLASVRAAFVSALPNLRFIAAGGTNPNGVVPVLPGLQAAESTIFGSDPNDGVVPLVSALGYSSGIAVHPVLAANGSPFDENHISLVNNDDVIAAINAQIDATSTPQLGCQDGSTFCSGPLGAPFAFSASALPSSATSAAVYAQDSTGAIAALQTVPQSGATLDWTMPVCLVSAPGNYSVFLTDSALSSNNVMLDVQPGSCTVTVAVSPASATVAAGGNQLFTASINGVNSTAVTWSVQEGTAGGVISSTGAYTASAMPGTYHVVATSTQDTNASATATVTVTAAPNAVPSITELEPATLPQGSAASSLTVVGTGFTSSSTVSFNSALHTTTFVDGEHLTTTLSASDLSTAGAFPVAVTTPAPGGGTSQTAVFMVSATTAMGQGWTWVSGSDTTKAPGVYGTLGQPSASSVPGARNGASTWTDSSGTLWLFGGQGVDSTGTSGVLNDLWKYSPATDLWTWVSGSQTVDAAGNYGTQGQAAAGNVPGARLGAASWVDGSGNFWLFGGVGPGGDEGALLNDLWEYLPASGEWIWVSGSGTPLASSVDGTLGQAAADNAPGARKGAASWTDSSGNFWLFGGLGVRADGTLGLLNDLWEFSPLTKDWTWFGPSNPVNTGNYGTLAAPSTSNQPGPRQFSAAWADRNGHLWLFGGQGFDAAGHLGDMSDLWEYLPKTNQWAWIGGSKTANTPGVFGTEGQASPADAPGARTAPMFWTDPDGHFWLFGGDSQTTGDLFDDLWTYSTATGDWTWVGGSAIPNAAGSYGIQGQAAPGNMPGARNAGATWSDADGQLWLFGGFTFNDLWAYHPASASAALTISPQAVSLVGGATQNFTASINGTASTAVTWSIKEGAAGGSITQAGAYTAPVTPGTYHVVATSTADTGISAVATVTVTSAGNPLPSITQLQPSSLPADSPATTLTIIGNGFTASSVASFNGVAHATTFSDAQHLSITLSATDLATQGAYTVSVTTPPPGGGTSNGIQFTVASPLPGTVLISPAAAAVPVGGVQTFTASVVGSSDGVTWALQEQLGSLVDATATSVILLPPSTTSTLHLVATNADDPTKTATVTISVIPALTFTVLHTFGVDQGVGSNPVGDLLQASDGNFYGVTASGGTSDQGTLFKIDSSGNFSTLSWFSGLGSPSGLDSGLIQGSDGDLYGTSVSGGTTGGGTVYKTDTAGNVTVLHSFASADESLDPYASLVQAKDGDFYGTTEYGSGNGTIFKLDPSGNLTLLHTFSQAEGSNSYSALIQARDGNFYGTSLLGGASGVSGNGTVFKMGASGNLTVLHSFNGGDGSEPAAALVEGSDGNLYGTTSSGGANNAGTAFRIDLSGKLTVLHSFAGQDGWDPLARLIQGTDGDFYGTTSAGGPSPGIGIIFRMDPAGNITVLHSFTGGAYAMTGVIQASDGNLYGSADSGPSGQGFIYRLVLPALATPPSRPKPARVEKSPDGPGVHSGKQL